MSNTFDQMRGSHSLSWLTRLVHAQVCILYNMYICTCIPLVELPNCQIMYIFFNLAVLCAAVNVVEYKYIYSRCTRMCVCVHVHVRNIGWMPKPLDLWHLEYMKMCTMYMYNIYMYKNIRAYMYMYIA